MKDLVQCNICKVDFLKHQKDIKRSKNHYCSRNCWNKKRAEHNIFCIKCDLKIDRSTIYCSKKYCKKCYVENFNEKFPEKYNKYEKHKVRIKRNLPLNHPPLRKIHDKEEGYFTASGYKRIYRKGHFAAKRKNGDILEHVWVMCEYLGRPLFKNENIHHKNGIRFDNRLDNLELWSRGQPAGQRVIDRIKYYIEFLEQYGYEVKKLNTISSSSDELKNYEAII